MGDEVGNLLIESIQSKLNILNKLNGKQFNKFYIDKNFYIQAIKINI